MAILLPLQHTSYTYPPTTAATDVFFPPTVYPHNVSRSCLCYCQLSDHQTPPLSPLQPGSRTARTDKSLLNVTESCSEVELWAAANLRVRTFYEFNEQTFGIEKIGAEQCLCGQRNSFGYELMAKAKSVAEAAWGISDLYVHVAVDNDEAAKYLCMNTLESDEPAWQARFLDRP